MHKLLEKVEDELDKIAEKGLTSSNLETTYKLIDIYKDIYEANHYKDCNSSSDNYGTRARDSRGRYMGDYWNTDQDREKKLYYNIDNRSERYMNRMREGLDTFNEGRERYRGSESEERMIEGIEMTMAAICDFVEGLLDHTETSKEKEVVRKYIEKMARL